MTCLSFHFNHFNSHRRRRRCHGLPGLPGLPGPLGLRGRCCRSSHCRPGHSQIGCGRAQNMERHIMPPHTVCTDRSIPDHNGAFFSSDSVWFSIFHPRHNTHISSKDVSSFHLEQQFFRENVFPPDVTPHLDGL